MEIGLFKVVERKTGNEACIERYLEEKWAEGCSEDAYWVLEYDGTPVVYDPESESMYRPPYGQFRARRGTELEGGWERIVYEGDFVLVKNGFGEWKKGVVKYGKYFSQGPYITIHVGWYVLWPDDVGLDTELGRWLADTSFNVRFVSPDQIDDYMPYVIPGKDEEDSSDEIHWEKRFGEDVPDYSESGFVSSCPDESNELYLDIPTEAEICDLFYREASHEDQDIAQLLLIKDKYRPGDPEARRKIFDLLNRKITGDYESVRQFMAALDQWVPDAVDIKAAWNANRKDVWSLLGIPT